MFAELTPGFYWILHTEPVTDGHGLIDEPWIKEPTVARFDGVRWYPIFDTPLADQFELRVLSEPIEPPVLKTKEDLMAEQIIEVVRRTVEAYATEGDGAVLEYDRDVLRARIVEVLKR